MAYQKYIEFHFNHKARWKWVQYIYTVAPKSWKYARNERKKRDQPIQRKKHHTSQTDYTEKINTNTKHVKYITDNNDLNRDNSRFDCEINVPVTPTNWIKLWNILQSIYNKCLFIFWMLNIFFVCFFGNEVL